MEDKWNMARVLPEGLEVPGERMVWISEVITLQGSQVCNIIEQGFKWSIFKVVIGDVEKPNEYLSVLLTAAVWRKWLHPIKEWNIVNIQDFVTEAQTHLEAYLIAQFQIWKEECTHIEKQKTSSPPRVWWMTPKLVQVLDRKVSSLSCQNVWELGLRTSASGSWHQLFFLVLKVWGRGSIRDEKHGWRGSGCIYLYTVYPQFTAQLESKLIVTQANTNERPEPKIKLFLKRKKMI